MIELASALASTAGLSAEHAWLDGRWDDVDRFARNELYQSQILRPERLERWVSPKTPESREAFLRVAARVAGGWPFGHTWPHDLMDYDKDAYPDSPARGGAGAGGPGAGSGRGSTGDHIRLPIGGCCMYSGPRGLAAYLDAAIRVEGAGDGCGPGVLPQIDIRLPLTYQNERLALTELPGGGVSFSVEAPHTVRVRVPSRVDPRRACLLVDGRRAQPELDVAGNRVVATAQPGRHYSVIWANPIWESHETLGSPNDGRVPAVQVGSRVTYQLSYQGGQLMHMEPCEGACLPYREGL